MTDGTPKRRESDQGVWGKLSTNQRAIAAIILVFAAGWAGAATGNEFTGLPDRMDEFQQEVADSIRDHRTDIAGVTSRLDVHINGNRGEFLYLACRLDAIQHDTPNERCGIVLSPATRALLQSLQLNGHP